MRGQCSVCSFLGHPLVEQRYIRNPGRAIGFFAPGGGWLRGDVMLGPEGRHGNGHRRGSGGDLENGTTGHGGKLFLRNDT